jgi:hypothetical protein
MTFIPAQLLAASNHFQSSVSIGAVHGAVTLQNSATLPKAESQAEVAREPETLQLNQRRVSKHARRQSRYNSFSVIRILHSLLCEFPSEYALRHAILERPLALAEVVNPRRRLGYTRELISSRISDHISYSGDHGLTAAPRVSFGVRCCRGGFETW